MTIEERILTILKEQNMNIKELAKLIDVPYANLHYWLSENRSLLKASCIVPICEALKITPEELLIGDAATRATMSYNGYVKITDGYVKESEGYTKLSEDEQRLINIFKRLSWIGKNIVINTAITELRNMAPKGNDINPAREA